MTLSAAHVGRVEGRGRGGIPVSPACVRSGFGGMPAEIGKQCFERHRGVSLASANRDVTGALITRLASLFQTT